MSASDVLRHLHCVNCTNRYDDSIHKPVIVAPCAHTACASCIDGLISETINRSNGQSDIIQCLVCDNPVSYPQASINHALLDIVRNFDESAKSMNSLPSAPSNSQIEPCQLCLVDEIDEPGVLHCFDCVVNLCDDHARIHAKRKDNSSHRTQKIDLNDPSVISSIQQSLNSRPANRCAKHPTNQFEYHCKSCDSLICVRCAVVDHQSHEKQELTVEWLNKQSDFQSIQELHDKLISQSNSCLQRIQNQIYLDQSNEQHALQAVTQTITEIAEAIRAALDHQHKSLIQHVHSITSHRTTELNQKWQAINQIKQTIDAGSQSVQFMVDSKDFSGFYQSKGDIQASLKDLEESVHSIDQAVDQTVNQPPTFGPPVISPPLQPAIDSIVQAVHRWFTSMQPQGSQTSHSSYSQSSQPLISTPPRSQQHATQLLKPSDHISMAQSLRPLTPLSTSSTQSRPSTDPSPFELSGLEGEERKVLATQQPAHSQNSSLGELHTPSAANHLSTNSPQSQHASPSALISQSHHASTSTRTQQSSPAQPPRQPVTPAKQSAKQSSKPAKNGTNKKQASTQSSPAKPTPSSRPSTASDREMKRPISHSDLPDEFAYDNFSDDELADQAASSWTEVVGKHARSVVHSVPQSAPEQSDDSSSTVTSASWPAMMARIRKKPATKNETIRLIKELCALSGDSQSNLKFLSSYDAVGIAVYLHGHLDNKELFPYIQPIVTQLMLLYGSHFEAFVIKKCRSVCEAIIKKQPRESTHYQLAYRLLWLLPEHERDLQDLMDSSDLDINSINFVARTESQVQQLLSNLLHFPSCTFLDLSQNTLSDSMCKRLADGLESIPDLRQLLLSSNHVSDAWCKILAPSLAFVPHLSQLVLTRNSVGAAGAKSLASFFDKIPHLNQLVLSGNSIGDAGGIAIAQSLKHLPLMNHLVLSSNKLGPSAAKALAENIKHCPHLSQLALSHNRVGDEGCRYLAGSFKHMPSLIQLALATNSIGDPGARSLSDSFKQLPSLRQLDLSGNTFGESGIRVFAQNLKYVPQMSQLKLSENPINDRGASILSEYMRYLPLLQLLDLRTCKISENAENKFIEKVAQYHAGQQDQLPVMKFRKL